MQADNKRIAKNTLFLYFRMLLLMAVSLYTSRVILAALGVEDYGIYNVIGGVVAMMSIISGSLSVAISRYITIELGRGNIDKLKIIFSTSVTIQFAMVVVCTVIAEVGGLWFLYHKMVIPPDRLYAANWALQCSIAAFAVGLISVPYNAVIVAHEKMSAFAAISIIEAVLRLGVVYLLWISPIDNLIAYSVQVLLVSIFIRYLYGYYCSRHFVEAHYKPIFDRKLIKEMMGFIGWAFWGNGVVVLKDQGTNILLNLFCGPVVNAARGVAMQVNSAVYQLVTNFLMAVNPQINKSYSVGDLEIMYNLIIRSGKMGFFILAICFFPLCANIDYVLQLWLVEVPPHTSAFIILTLLYSLLDCFGNPLVCGVLAQGNIRNYEIVLTVLYLSNVVASYFALKAGYAPESVFVLNVIFKVVVIGALLWHSRIKYGFPIRRFFKESALRSFVVFCIGALFAYFFQPKCNTELGTFLLSCFVNLGFMILVVYYIGLSRDEAKYMTNLVKVKVTGILRK